MGHTKTAQPSSRVLERWLDEGSKDMKRAAPRPQRFRALHKLWTGVQRRVHRKLERWLTPGG